MKSNKKIRVCGGPRCSLRGADRIMEVLEENFKTRRGEVNQQVDLNFCGCTTFCERGPNVVEDNKNIYHEARTKDIAERLARGAGEKITPLNANEIDSLLNF